MEPEIRFSSQAKIFREMTAILIKNWKTDMSRFDEKNLSAHHGSAQYESTETDSLV